jgi:hypothetical protein
MVRNSSDPRFGCPWCLPQLEVRIPLSIVFNPPRPLHSPNAHQRLRPAQIAARISRNLLQGVSFITPRNGIEGGGAVDFWEDSKIFSLDSTWTP